MTIQDESQQKQYDPGTPRQRRRKTETSSDALLQHINEQWDGVDIGSVIPEAIEANKASSYQNITIPTFNSPFHYDVNSSISTTSTTLDSSTYVTLSTPSGASNPFYATSIYSGSNIYSSTTGASTAITVIGHDGHPVFLSDADVQFMYSEYEDYKQIKEKIDRFPIIQALWNKLLTACKLCDNVEEDDEQREQY